MPMVPVILFRSVRPDPFLRRALRAGQYTARASWYRHSSGQAGEHVKHLTAAETTKAESTRLNQLLDSPTGTSSVDTGKSVLGESSSGRVRGSSHADVGPDENAVRRYIQDGDIGALFGSVCELPSSVSQVLTLDVIDGC
eukprot:TRINITY_DN101105_c0_g1_i1.p1 TRINITY_DN101105_c0_g1~~TRINITY_DN101105_c0_g1_i1.p1  ORF type:complete len:140 (-),score=18.77 TRINITY_DN101105_c0_g1_i1:34-453(-)